MNYYIMIFVSFVNILFFDIKNVVKLMISWIDLIESEILINDKALIIQCYRLQ